MHSDVIFNIEKYVILSRDYVAASDEITIRF